MRYPIDALITPPRLDPEEILGLNRPVPHLLKRFSEPEIELRFADGSRATFMGPIVNDFIRRMPRRGEQLRNQVWFPIMYPPH